MAQIKQISVYQPNFKQRKFHKIVFSQTHNLEVSGSSPGWSTLKISNLEEIQVADFLFRENNGKTQ